MSRKEGDLCPHCEEGHLTVDPDREIREEKGGFASHRTWLCDKCGEKCKDLVRGINETANVSETVKATKIEGKKEKRSWFSRFRKK